MHCVVASIIVLLVLVVPLPCMSMQAGDSAGQKLGGALLNAVIFICVVAGMTFVLFLLFKYKVRHLAKFITFLLGSSVSVHHATPPAIISLVVAPSAVNCCPSALATTCIQPYTTHDEQLTLA